jgi:hypothetical protein
MQLHMSAPSRTSPSTVSIQRPPSNALKSKFILILSIDFSAMQSIQQSSANQMFKSTANPSCPHGRRKDRCKQCGGGWSFCGHGRRRWECRDCGGSSICPHNRRRARCRDCGGASICEHGRDKWTCRACGGRGLYSQARRRTKCRVCCRRFSSAQGCQHETCKKCDQASLQKEPNDPGKLTEPFSWMLPPVPPPPHQQSLPLIIMTADVQYQQTGDMSLARLQPPLSSQVFVRAPVTPHGQSPELSYPPPPKPPLTNVPTPSSWAGPSWPDMQQAPHKPPFSLARVSRPEPYYPPTPPNPTTAFTTSAPPPRSVPARDEGLTAPGTTALPHKPPPPLRPTPVRGRPSVSWARAGLLSSALSPGHVRNAFDLATVPGYAMAATPGPPQWPTAAAAATMMTEGPQSSTDDVWRRSRTAEAMAAMAATTATAGPKPSTDDVWPQWHRRWPPPCGDAPEPPESPGSPATPPRVGASWQPTAPAHRAAAVRGSPVRAPTAERWPPPPPFALIATGAPAAEVVEVPSWVGAEAGAGW